MDSRIKTIADHYGYEAQSRQCMEECAELIQAINKLRRFESKNPIMINGEKYNALRSKITEEMADVQITISQMQYLLAIDGDDLEGAVERKLDRQMQRVKEESE